MSVKKIIIQLEVLISLKIPNYKAKFFAKRRNTLIHLGLDKALLSFGNFKLFLDEIDIFLSERLINF